MLSELENKTLKTLNTKFFNLTDNSGIKSYVDDIQLSMVELYRKYKDPSNVDRLFEIKKDVSEIHTDMKSNVKKIMVNIEDATVIYII
jgi:hypothetical protein